jgi:hypothetical protein
MKGLEMTSFMRKLPGHRPLLGRMVLFLTTFAVGVPALLGAPAAGPGAVSLEQASRQVKFVGAGQTAPLAAGQVTAHDGKFWLGSQQIKLRGINLQPSFLGTFPTDADFDKISSWGMNYVRLVIAWSTVEPIAPINVAGSWVHTYDARQISYLRNYITWANNHGLYVVLSDGGVPGPSPPLLTAWWPKWLYTPTYNSHGQLYVDPKLAQTDYWTDALQQKFTKDFWSYIGQQFAGTAGLAGYEPLNEPQRGNLPNTHQSTQTVLDVGLALARAIRIADPARIVFFMSRGCCGEGVPNADLSDFVSLGNVALDIHDYFGGRWGFGLMMDPDAADYGEVHQVVERFTLSAGPYLGTTTAQVQVVQNFKRFVESVGIPLLVGQFSTDPAELNPSNLVGTMTSAYNSEGVSWALYAYTGKYGILKQDGTLQPWGPIVIAAAQAP